MVDVYKIYDELAEKVCKDSKVLIILLDNMKSAIKTMNICTINYEFLVGCKFSSYINYSEHFVEEALKIIDTAISQLRETMRKGIPSYVVYNDDKILQLMENKNLYRSFLEDIRDHKNFIRKKLITGDSLFQYGVPFIAGQVTSFNIKVRKFHRDSILLHKKCSGISGHEIIAVFNQRDNKNYNHYSIYVNYNSISRNNTLGIGLSLKPNLANDVKFDALDSIFYMFPGHKYIGTIQISHKLLFDQPNTCISFATSAELYTANIQDLQTMIIDDFLDNT